MIQEYKYIFTKHFDEHEVKVYGGRKDVVFECNNVCLILGISNDIMQRESSKEDIFIKVYTADGNSKSKEMLTEETLNKLISLSTTPEAKRFSEWITKVTKEALLILLQDKDDELVKYKHKKYEEIEKTGHLYIMLLDGGYKVGKTFTTTNKRAKGLQTGNVEDIQIIYDYETNNEHLLEKVVHFILARYRVNPKREFFDCKVEYMKMVIRMCGTFLDTFKSTFENIEFEEIIKKLNEKQFGVKLREFDAITIQNTENTSELETKNDNTRKEETTNNEFENWLSENIEEKENGILKLTDVCELCDFIKTGANKKAPPRTASKYKVQISEFIKAHFPELKSEYQDTTIDGKRFRGWLGVQLKRNGVTMQIQHTENTVKLETTNDGISNDQKTRAFEKWFNENVERRQNGLLKLKDVCAACYLIKTGHNKKAHSKTASKYKKLINDTVSERYPNSDVEFKDSTMDGKRYAGWLGLQLKYKSDFDEWLHEKIVFKEGRVLKLHNVCKRFTGKDLNTHESVKYKKKIEEFITECFPHCKHEHGTIKIGSKTYKGWKNLCVQDA